MTRMTTSISSKAVWGKERYSKVNTKIIGGLQTKLVIKQMFSDYRKLIKTEKDIMNKKNQKSYFHI